MTGRPPADDGVCGPCRIGECEHCEGNVDLKGGAGPAVALLRCSHRCPRGQAGQGDRT